MENAHLAWYRTTSTNSPLALNQKPWTDEERENLKKGIKQQFQEMVLHFSVEEFSCSDGSNNLDDILVSIRDLEITPEKMREFLRKFNRDQLASLFVPGRSGAECQARWLNSEDPLINFGNWTRKEEKTILYAVQQRGFYNWFDVAVTLGTNRTPFQFLSRFQRSLDALILKRDWTEEEDAQLCAAVESFGESNWQPVASTLSGRTGTQCSNRWKKSIHPSMTRKGSFTPDESKRLKIAVKFFGPKKWNKIAEFVPGRTQAQCREKWSNCLDPSLKTGEWSEDEDSILRAAVEEYGNQWSKVAKHIPGRTDSDCRRRFKEIAPDEMRLLQAARRMKKVALMGNFVDRESERPALGPDDFIPTPAVVAAVSKQRENAKQSRRNKRKSRGAPESGETNDATSGKRARSRRQRRKPEPNSPEEASATTNDTGVAITT